MDDKERPLDSARIASIVSGTPASCLSLAIGIDAAQQDVIFEETLTVDRPVSGSNPKFEEVVAAMAGALDAACEQVATRVATALAAERPAGGSSTP